MSSHTSNEITDEIYHRIYRLIKRNLSPHSIAATLHLPVRTVLAVINRLQRTEKSQEELQPGAETGESLNSTDFLDTYFYPKTRYAIIDIVGTLSDNQIETLQAEVRKALDSNWKAVAIRMSDVTFLSNASAHQLLSMKEDFSSLGRFFALLDPSQAIEPTLTASKIEELIPIFGTERAFEEAAFSKKRQTFSRHSNQNES